jgi:hypothetical protein
MSKTAPLITNVGVSKCAASRVSTAMTAYLSGWPHLGQVAQLTRTVTVRRTNKTTEEVVYLITDLDPTAASPGRLLTLVRGHWSI